MFSLFLTDPGRFHFRRGARRQNHVHLGNGVRTPGLESGIVIVTDFDCIVIRDSLCVLEVVANRFHYL